MFSSKSVKKIEKVISKFFLFNEDIHRNEKSRGIREVDDDGGGEDVRVLSSSSSDDGEDGDDNDEVMAVMAVVVMMTIMRATIVLMEELIVLKVICKY